MARTVLITGSSGIASATAKQMAGRGDSVFLIGKVREECEALSTQIRAARFFVGDVGDETQIDQAVQLCLNECGQLDAVFNVAGLSGRSLGDGPLHQCSTTAWETLMRVHASGTFFVCRAVINHWLTAGREGVILNTSSVLAHFPEREFFATHAYAASKAAVEGMTVAAASYYAPHKIRLNVLAPGLVRTPMSARAQGNPAILEFTQRKQPLAGGFIEVEEIARVAAFLLSDDSRPITGEIIRADAGWAVTG